MNRNTCPRCRQIMRALAIAYRELKDNAILHTAKGYRDECYHRTPEQKVTEAAQLSHARAVADLHDDGGVR